MNRPLAPHTAAAGLVLAALSCASAAAAAEPRYEPNWSSLDTRPCPGWYLDAKFGIFIHWGV
ncbi:MAG TPA: alpha-L-fucosidase, partial [Opitutaceae bacterium]|nr:alpha-L-fucosidase [Opitutaceae bacterium]